MIDIFLSGWAWFLAAGFLSEGVLNGNWKRSTRKARAWVLCIIIVQVFTAIWLMKPWYSV